MTSPRQPAPQQEPTALQTAIASWVIALVVSGLAYYGAGFLLGSGSEPAQAVVFGVLMATLWSLLDRWKARR